MTRRKVDLRAAYRLIGPGPLVLVSSLSGGRPGLTPIAWHMPVSDELPVVALTIWEGHFIYKAILETGDFVINIPSNDMAPLCRKLGSVSGRDCDKFRKFGLVAEKAKKVKSPLLSSAIGILECKLRQDKALLKKYNIVLGDVVYAEAEKSAFAGRWRPEENGPRMMHHLGDEVFSMPGRCLA